MSKYNEDHNKAATYTDTMIKTTCFVFRPHHHFEYNPATLTGDFIINTKHSDDVLGS